MSPVVTRLAGTWPIVLDVAARTSCGRKAPGTAMRRILVGSGTAKRI